MCATSNRAATAGPWDINARVEQLTREFSIKEDQLQRMLEILGIFYRPCDPALQPVTQPMVRRRPSLLIVITVQERKQLRREKRKQRKLAKNSHLLIYPSLSPSGT